MELTNAQAPIGRFAPSPSARLHAGNIFSFLVAWVIVKRNGGYMRLRIDDLDRSRCKPHFSEQVMRDLELLGLDWTGEVLYQSTRDEAYLYAYQNLVRTQHCYPCYCTRNDILAASAPHQGSSVVYAGTCRNLTAQEQAAHQKRAESLHRAPSMRIAVPNVVSSFVDELQGTHSANLSTDFGDFILKRADGGFAYHIATVLDDDYQGVTHVCRGCDLLPSTHAQLFLQEALGFRKPAYAHVPLLMSHDGRRLAKRDHDASLEELLTVYHTPAGVLGHIAFIAGMVDEDEPYTTEQLIKHARLDALKGLTKITWC